MMTVATTEITAGLTVNPEKILDLYPPLASLPGDRLNTLLRPQAVMQVPAGTMIFAEHQPCQGFPLLLEGSIKVVKQSSSGRELMLYRVASGGSCIITSSCLLGHSPYNARGITEEETDILLLPRPVFDELLAYPPFRRFVFELFSERLSELMQLVEEVAFRKLDQRLAALLLGKGRVVRTTHQQLADELGSVREIVSRLLKGFADQGCVALGREQIEILDPGGLRQLASDSR